MKNKPTFTDSMEHQPSATAGFTKAYADGNAPWDIGKPQPPFVAIADQVKSPVLDAGCGKGNTALFFAARGHQVTGIDFVELAISQARAKAAEMGLSVKFLVKDAMTLGEWDERFASVIDSGLFHVYGGEARRTYVRGLAHVVIPGGRLFLYCFAEGPHAPGGGLSKADLQEAFADGWAIESLAYDVGGELNPAFVAAFPGEFPAGEPKMWFAIIRRND